MRFLAALCTLVILNTFICITQSASCCVSYSKRPLKCHRLLGYTIQTINTSCDISAVIFHVNGRFVCADPLKKWTQRGMSCVDEMRKKKAQILKDRTHGSA
ncbi:C-C motif chemokine 20b [Paralichthys olivaceus]|uniref:C-C motif chemokine 20b n=1 Tax=Paralichthys olivaceus TaxID=8255 RepID=UPI00097DC950|nr:PREDICTED: C-C motif chemokine 20-like [Paralichthys olivaceus]